MAVVPVRAKVAARASSAMADGFLGRWAQRKADARQGIGLDRTIEGRGGCLQKLGKIGDVTVCCVRPQFGQAVELFLGKLEQERVPAIATVGAAAQQGLSLIHI